MKSSIIIPLIIFLFFGNSLGQAPIALPTDSMPIVRSVLTGDCINRPPLDSGRFKFETQDLIPEGKLLNNTLQLHTNRAESLLNYNYPNTYIRHLQPHLPNSIHEDGYASDISRLSGANVQMRGIRAELLTNNSKFYYVPGMTPTVTFLNDSILVCVRFGAKNNLVTTIDADSMKMKDASFYIGRQNLLKNLMWKGCQSALMSSTTGGAYFYLNEKGNMMIPVTEMHKGKSFVRRIFNVGKYKCKDMKGPVEESGIWKYIIDGTNGHIDSIVKYIVTKSDYPKESCMRSICEERDELVRNENTTILRAIVSTLPDHNGNIWFTTDQGEVFVFNEQGDNYYYTDLNKLGYTFTISRLLQNDKYTFLDDLEGTICRLSDVSKKYISNLRKNYPSMNSYPMDTILDRIESKKNHIRIDRFEHYWRNDTIVNGHHKIQNSFISDSGFVYIITNQALYKLSIKDGIIYSHWNDTNIRQQYPQKMHSWDNTFCGLQYDNSGLILPGQIHAGSGTTPTLLRSNNTEQILFCDNDYPQIKLKAVTVSTGSYCDNNNLVLFHPFGSACENSVVAYNDSITISNTFGYRFPYDKESNMAGGLERLYWTQSGWQKDNNWWNTLKYFDCKTATPKFSLSDGLLYVYNTGDLQGISGKWRMHGIDWGTGKDVSHIYPQETLCYKKRHYKILNNLWGTFTIGPKNSFYIASRIGLLKISEKK